MYYASIGLFSIAIHMIINFDAMRKDGNVGDNRSQERYRHFLYAVTAYYISDILWGTLYEWRIVFLTYIDTVFYFLSMVISVFLWTRFVVSYLNSKGRFGKMLLYSGGSIFIFEVIALIINFFVPVVFGFAPDGEYQPQSARYITLFIQMGLFLLTSVYTLYAARKCDERAKMHHRAIGFSGIFMTVFIALQSLYPLLPFYAVGCLLATCMVHSFVYRDETIEHKREMGTARQKAYRDPLTGVKNKLAYLETLGDMEFRLEEGTLGAYSVAVFDLNNLKEINDVHGHDAGDKSIKEACHQICARFKHSPVFRIGGDEFVVILEGEDFEMRNQLLSEFNSMTEDNQRHGRVAVACGMEDFCEARDEDYNDVFRRADKKMYDRKQWLKKLSRASGE